MNDKIDSSLLAHDAALRARLSVTALCGIDEAGRGPLAGPVTAAAVVLPAECGLAGLADSKQLSARRRAALEPLVLEAAVASGLGWVEAEQIDRLGILQATFLAMKLALEQLAQRPDHLLVDGRDYPFAGQPGSALVRGDSRSACIAAASILAKEARDRRMREEHERWPDYGFDCHKGYGTAAHLDALRRLGRCPLHRKSFRLPWEKDRLELAFP